MKDITITYPRVTISYPKIRRLTTERCCRLYGGICFGLSSGNIPDCCSKHVYTGGCCYQELKTITWESEDKIGD